MIFTWGLIIFLANQCDHRFTPAFSLFSNACTLPPCLKKGSHSPSGLVALCLKKDFLDDLHFWYRTGCQLHCFTCRHKNTVAMDQLNYPLELSDQGPGWLCWEWINEQPDSSTTSLLLSTIKAQTIVDCRNIIHFSTFPYQSLLAVISQA